MPRSVLNLEGFPSHKRRKAIRASIIRVLVPGSGSIELCSYTGLPVEELRGMPELLRLRAVGACYIKESPEYASMYVPKKVAEEPKEIKAEVPVVEIVPEVLPEVPPAESVVDEQVPAEPVLAETPEVIPEEAQKISVPPPQFRSPNFLLKEESFVPEVSPAVTLETNGGISDEKPKKKRGRKPKVV